MKKKSKKSSKTSSVKKSKTLQIVILCIVFLVIAGFVYKSQSKKGMMRTTWSTKMMASPQLQQLLLTSNSLIIPGTDPATETSLKQKTTEYGDFENDKTKPFGTVTIGDVLLGDKNHIFTTLAINYGGSGEMFYLVAFDNSNSGYKMTSSVLLGDRIQIDSLTGEGTVVSISYRTHSPTQAMVDYPNVKVERKFKYEDNVLVEQ